MDDSGTRTFGYNTYGERESDSLVVDGDTHLIAEQLDSFGRSTGFVYSKNGSVQHTVTTGYGADGRISSAGFTHSGEVKPFGYEYLGGTNLLHKLTKPNNMTLTQTYEANRDLLTGMAYHRGTTLVAQREYTYDILGRPTARNTSRNGQIVNDTFAHNTRSELTAATVNGADYEYAYDNIGNRQQSTEGNDVTVYDTNALNQYAAISENGADAFVPQFDADGNQTLIKTETGIWSAVYNAENRPVTFTNSDSSTVVECAYDSMGRRAYKKVTVDGSVTLHQRYVYRGYLQIACIDLTRSHHPVMWLVTWDPSQPVATRPLSIRINGTWYTYGWDLTKNICELYSTEGRISTSYTYSPFGKVTASGSLTQPIQWSSEVWDVELELVYYNYRYYNLLVGRWLGKDLWMEADSYNLFQSLKNNPIDNIDSLGNNVVVIAAGIDYRPEGSRNHDNNQFNFRMAAAQQVRELMETTPDEIYEILVETETYKLRNEGEPTDWLAAFQWHRKRDYYSEIFYHKTNVIVRYINNKQELCEALEKTHTGKKRTGTTLISSLYYFGHGEVGKLGIRYPFSPDMLTWYIGINDIPRIFKKKYFVENPYVLLQTCHAASTSKAKRIKRSFAEVLSKHLEGTVDAMHGRSDYSPIGKIGLSGIPGKPKPGETFAEIVDRKENEKPKIVQFINGKLVK